MIRSWTQRLGGATAVATAAALALGTPSAAAATGEVERIADTTRYRTAAAISVEAYAPGTADAVVLARGDEYPDGLAGAALATVKNGPLLLTTPDGIAEGTSEELDRVLPKGRTIYVLGGPSAIQPSVVERLENRGWTVVRIGGANRFETAVNVAKAANADPSRVVVATGLNFPDALVAGALAGTDGVVVLSNGEALTDETKDYLEGTGATERLGVGGPASRAAAPYLTQSYRGANRYETATAAAGIFYQGGSSSPEVGVTSGDKFPDALSGGAFMAKQPGPLLLTQPRQLTTATQKFLQDNAAAIDKAYVFGGDSVVRNDLDAEIEKAIQ